MTRDGKTLWWLLGGGATLVLLSVLCCCGMSVFGSLTPAVAPPTPEPSTPEVALPESDAVPPPSAQPPTETELIAEGDVPVVGADEPSGEVAATIAEGPGLPGIGATRAHWEATHTRARGFTPGVVFEPMVEGSDGHGLEPFYAGVVGDDRISSYSLNLPRGTTFETARALVRREFPPDAREVRTRRLGACRMIRYSSPTMRREFENERHGGDVEVGFFSPDADVFDPRHVTFATVGFYVGEDIDC